MKGDAKQLRIKQEGSMPGEMAVYDQPGEEHASFMQWAISQGVEINGVAPARFPGRRLGMVALRAIEEEEIMVTVPRKAMLTIDCIPPSFVNKFLDGISLHGLLAAFLTLGDPKLLKKYDLWRAVWPSRQDFEDGMPVLWPERLRMSNSKFQKPSYNPICLPPSASGLWNSVRKKPIEHEYETKHQNLLAQQEKRLLDAWRSVIAVFPDTDWDTYSYYWLIVNTRSFFYLLPGEEPPEDRNDALALVPFADYFNHVDDAQCDVNFDGEKYTFKATRRYEKGEEIYMSYGPHPNDFLLIEYGFYLDENESDAIYLDDIVFRDLTASEKEELIFQQYYGNYQVTSTTGPCFRTEVAACMKHMSRRDWRNYVLGQGHAPPNPEKTNATILGWIGTYVKEANVTIDILEKMLEKEEDDDTVRIKVKTLIRRWEQIKRLCEQAAVHMNAI